MIDENALKTATEPYGVTIYLTDVRDIIEAYEATKSSEQPVQKPKKCDPGPCDFQPGIPLMCCKNCEEFY